jgi:uncharacterized phage infection (PIP) family protein YhgE
MTNREVRKETRFIIVMAIVIAIIVIIAFYGYLSGSWDPPPS